MLECVWWSEIMFLFVPFCVADVVMSMGSVDVRNVGSLYFLCSLSFSYFLSVMRSEVHVVVVLLSS